MEDNVVSKETLIIQAIKKILIVHLERDMQVFGTDTLFHY